MSRQGVSIAESAPLRLCGRLSCKCYMLVLCCEGPVVCLQTTNYRSVRHNSGKDDDRGFLTE